MRVRGVESRRRSQAGARIAGEAEVVVAALLDQELLQAGVRRNPREEVLIGRQHAAELLVEASGVRLGPD